MGIMVNSLLWVMQDLYHQPYHQEASMKVFGTRPKVLKFSAGADFPASTPRRMQTQAQAQDPRGVEPYG